MLLGPAYMVVRPAYKVKLQGAFTCKFVRKGST